MTQVWTSEFTDTLLPLQRFANILQVNPIHFYGAVVNTLWPDLGCGDVWPEYTYQTAQEIVSRYYLATQIAGAEDEVKRLLGYSPAPMFEREEHSYFNHKWTGLIQTNFRKIIQPGQKATTLIDTVTPVYSDVNSDGFSETATLTVTIGDVSPTEIKLYFPNYTNREIRPIRSISVTNGVATIVVDSWLLIDPSNYEDSLGEWEAINITTTTPLASEIDVKRVYVDPDLPSVRFIWSKKNSYGTCGYCAGIGCPTCAEETQDGCLAVVGDGLVKVYPATVSDGSWTSVAPTRNAPPDRVIVWYFAGDRDYGRLDPMPIKWAQAISYLAAARLSLPVCSCTNVRNIFNDLQRDLTRSERNSFYVRNIEGDIFSNPLGTTVGEYRAWQLIHQLPQSSAIGGVI